METLPVMPRHLWRRLLPVQSGHGSHALKVYVHAPVPLQSFCWPLGGWRVELNVLTGPSDRDMLKNGSNMAPEVMPLTPRHIFNKETEERKFYLSGWCHTFSLLHLDQTKGKILHTVEFSCCFGSLSHHSISSSSTCSSFGQNLCVWKFRWKSSKWKSVRNELPWLLWCNHSSSYHNAQCSWWQPLV